MYTYLLHQKYKNCNYLSFWASYSKNKPLFGILVWYAIQFWELLSVDSKILKEFAGICLLSTVAKQRFKPFYYQIQQKYKNCNYLSFWASHSKTKPLFGILVLYAIQFW